MSAPYRRSVSVPSRSWGKFVIPRAAAPLGIFLEVRELVHAPSRRCHAPLVSSGGMVMPTRTLAHVSDLHVGKSAANDRSAEDLCAALAAAGVDDVLVTGDVTHRGRGAELARFERIFAPLRDRLVVVPGNHDRLGDDVARHLMQGRVEVERRPGLHVVRIDSTAAHNRALLSGHGALSIADLDFIDAAVGAAPPGVLVVLALHHHLLPLPPEGIGERLANLLGWPYAAELERGRELLSRLRGRCDVVAHGHRHVASETSLEGGGRSLRVLNAGCTSELGAVRLLAHAGGRVLADGWLDLAGDVRAPELPSVPALPAAA
jgi:predicted phosphodiesterase